MTMKDKIAPYVKQGMTAGEIHKLHPEWNYHTIYFAMPNRKRKQDKRPVEEKVELSVVGTKGWNKDKKACKKCMYRGKGAGRLTHNFVSISNGCNFILIEGHSRGCKVEDCNVFVKGKKVNMNPKGTRKSFDMEEGIDIW